MGLSLGGFKVVGGEWKLRKRLRRELASLGIDGPTDMADVCGRLGRQRGRPIRLVPFPLEVPGPFGLWVSTRSSDCILYQAETTKVHQEHIIAHEVGHILAGHQSDEFDDEIWRQIMPDISPVVIRRLLQRTHYDTVEEREAETVATILLERAAVAGSVTVPGRSGRARRMQRLLGDSRSWL